MFQNSILSLTAGPIIILLVGWALVRIMGKRAVAEMSSFDLVVMLVIGTVLATPLSSKSILDTIIASAFLGGTYLAISYLNLNNRLRWWITAKPTVSNQAW